MRAAIRARAVALAPARSSDISSFAVSNGSCSPSAFVMKIVSGILGSVNYRRNNGERKRHSSDVSGEGDAESGREYDSLERARYRNIFTIALRFPPCFECKVIPEGVKLCCTNSKGFAGRGKNYCACQMVF